MGKRTEPGLTSRSISHPVRVLITLLLLIQAGCVGTVIGTASDIVIETVKIPFKIGAAVVDAVSSDDEDDEGVKKR